MVKYTKNNFPSPQLARDFFPSISLALSDETERKIEQKRTRDKEKRKEFGIKIVITVERDKKIDMPSDAKRLNSVTKSNAYPHW